MGGDDVGITAGIDDPAPVRETSEAFVGTCGAAPVHLLEPEVGAVGEVEFLRGSSVAHVDEVELEKDDDETWTQDRDNSIDGSLSQL